MRVRGIASVTTAGGVATTSAGTGGTTATPGVAATTPDPIAELQTKLNKGVSFASGGSALSEEAKADLTAWATTINATPGVTEVFVTGHGDAEASETDRTRAATRQISRERALAVRDFLIAQGVAADKLTLEAKGSSEPAQGLAPTDDLNRRVEIKINP